jgi:error-prone DNA polymerase
VDVNASDWDHELALDAQDPQPARGPIRLGLRLVKGLSRDGATRLVEARRDGPFTQVADLRRRARLDKGDLQALVGADALARISGHRRQSQWQVLAMENAKPLLAYEAKEPVAALDDAVALPAAGVAEEVLADYRALSLTLRAHPLALLRERSPFDRCKRQAELAGLGSGRFVRIAGLVTCRQRPGTASGVVFLTLEDETGNANVVVWPRVQERFRAALMNARLLLVKGTVEARDGVIHVMAGALFDMSGELEGLGVQSRDFH